VVLVVLVVLMVLVLVPEKAKAKAKAKVQGLELELGAVLGLELELGVVQPALALGLELELVVVRVRVLVVALGLELEPVQVLAGVRVVVRVPELGVALVVVQEAALVEQVRGVQVPAILCLYWGNPADKAKSNPLTLRTSISTIGSPSLVKPGKRTVPANLKKKISRRAACLPLAVAYKIPHQKMTSTQTLGTFMTGKTF
jgi:hypothetical protein